MKVVGRNDKYGLGGSLNSQTSGPENIKTPCQSRLNVPSLLSFSIGWHSVWIMQNGEAFAVGPNNCGQIMSTMAKETFKEDRKIEIRYKNGQRCKFISAVCGDDYTLYQVSGETSSGPSQLVYAHSYKETIFLNIGKRSPLSLFGGYYTSAVIDTEGGVIIITDAVFDSPTSEVEFLSLPDCELAVKAACCDDTVIVLSASGRLFECPSKARRKPFSEVKELSGIKIKEISGTYRHFFAVSEDGQVFGRGNNYSKRLGKPSDIKELKEFQIIESVDKFHVVEAFAGIVDSFFKTSEGPVLGCGSNGYNKLMLKDEKRTNVYPPAETTITRDATFCILGDGKSVVFLGVEPPPNTPNRKISFSKKSLNPKSSTPAGKTTKAEPTEIQELRELLESTKKENISLKEELKRSKKRISELEKELEEQQNKSSTVNKGNESESGSGKEGNNGVDIIDTTTLDNLKRVKSLGRGATSEVFLVTREERLALKVYYPDALTENNDDNEDDDDEEKFFISADNARRLLREYEGINGLNHANIVKAFGISFGDSTHPPAILLEYCSSTLKKKIKKLTDSERICAIVDLSSAMKEVHSVGIIHRDLKLENILLDDDNKIKVSDFGLCTLMSVEAETKSRTQMTGTLKYMAPELLQERTDYDEKVDVYAFGVVVYLILTKGEFPKISVIEVGNGKKATIPSSISEFSRKLIDKCWSLKASDRPSFSEISASLKGNENKLL